MSLQLAAQHMASRGRGPDTQLVHMAPEEVAGLQALAKAHGGSLTINPDTGLAEAGFLKRILPMVIGAGLAATGVGAPMAALMVGGGYGVAKGSLKEGLMAGLGAYGGAGIAGSLMGAGAAGVGAAGAGASEMAATQAALQQNALVSAGIPSSAAAGTGSMSFAPGMSTNVLGAAPVGGPMSVPLASPIQAQQAVLSAAPQTVTKMAPTFMENLAQMGRGAQSLGTEAGRTALLNKDNLKYGLAGLAPMLFQEQKQAEREEEYPEYYSFDAGFLGGPSASGNYFSPTLKQIPRRAADGGMMSSGPLQAMSDRNEAETLMANGGQRFAEGGETKARRSVEQDPYYTMSGQSGDAFRYLMGERASSRPTPVAAPVAVAPAASLANSTEIASATPAAGRFSSIAKRASAGRDAPSMFAFDPITGQLRNTGPRPDLQAAEVLAATSYFGDGGGGGDYGGGFGDSASGGVGGAGGPGSTSAASASDFGGDYARGGVTRRMANGGQRFAAGGQVNLQGTFTAGDQGGGQLGALREQMNAPSVMPNANPFGGYQQNDSMMPNMGGFDPRAMQADSSGFAKHMQMAQQQEQRVPGSTFFGSQRMANGGIASLAQGGQSHLGDYSDGGRLLRGPGDGVSDDIPASIGDKQPARLADGEFVVPARIVSELGNGSTEAGARKLYAMMDRVQKARKKSIGKDRVAVNSRSEKLLPA